MADPDAQCTPDSPPSEMPPKDILGLARRILRSANSTAARAEFLRELTGTLLDFSQCDQVELWLKKGETSFRCQMTQAPDQPFTMETVHQRGSEENPFFGRDWSQGGLAELCRCVIERRYPPSLTSVTPGGSFWTGNLAADLPVVLPDAPPNRPDALKSDFASLVVIPLLETNESMGLVLFKSRAANAFDAGEIEFFESAIHTAGLAVANQLAHASLRERVKELTCLYRLAKLTEDPALRLRDILQQVADLLPPAWQYPEITAARIVVNDRSFVTPNYVESNQRQVAEISVHGELCGQVEVVYIEEKPELDEGPFLNEERSLINAVSRQISLIIERRQAAEERANLQDQLRHADRLATIGQLSAGVAHELNEPLGNILAYAQLAQKSSDLPAQAARDIEKIVGTSLHAREVVKKLMLFARQMPPQKIRVCLNAVVEEGLGFLEARCAKGGVSLVRDFADPLPEITADPSQLHQVLVNLVVNAVQAMPDGGILRVRTRKDNRHVLLAVEDTGIGMREDVLKRVFLPFFTTKDVNEGTGLGLAVVHGIINTHGGRIDVESSPGKGARFEIRLPAADHEDEEARS